MTSVGSMRLCTTFSCKGMFLYHSWEESGFHSGSPKKICKLQAYSASVRFFLKYLDLHGLYIFDILKVKIYLYLAKNIGYPSLKIRALCSPLIYTNYGRPRGGRGQTVIGPTFNFSVIHLFIQNIISFSFPYKMVDVHKYEMFHDSNHVTVVQLLVFLLKKISFGDVVRSRKSLGFDWTK